MLQRLITFRNEYPKQFWTLFFGTLVNSAGSGLIFPFLSLFLNRRLGFSMTDVGILFGVYAAVSIAFQLLGGGLVDRIGRKPVMLFSLIGSAVITVIFGVVSESLSPTMPGRIWLVGGMLMLFGVFGPIFGPASNAMVADLVPGEKRASAYGLMRIVSNLGIAIGPAIGGFIATRSYLVLFVLAGVASLLYGILVLLRVKETNPASVAKEEGQVEEPAHYGAVLKDSPFLMFSLLMLISTVVYAQMNTTLPVYLKNGFNVSESWYGLLMSLNAAMVVVFQYSVTRWVSKKASGLVMALGMLFYAVGFGMFGFIGTLPLFFLAQAIWTTGELIVSPTSQAFVANAAPRTLRGTYMGIFGITWGIGYGLGPLLGGLAMDGLGGQYIWYAAFGLDLLVVLAFIAFNRTMVAREKVSLQ